MNSRGGWGGKIVGRKEEAGGPDPGRSGAGFGQVVGGFGEGLGLYDILYAYAPPIALHGTI